MCMHIYIYIYTRIYIYIYIYMRIYVVRCMTNIMHACVLPRL